MASKSKQPWPYNAWYQAAWSHEVRDKPFPRTMLDEQIVLFRDAEGRAHALQDRCCHRATPLRLGHVVPEGLQCGYHGLVFDGAGRCVRIPGQDTIPPQARVRSYPLVERQEILWVWMGEPAKADPAQIVDHPWNDDHENWPHDHNVLHIKCDYMLLIDNLMDLTHVPHVHRKTIGGGPVMDMVNARMDVTRTERGFRRCARRHFANCFQKCPSIGFGRDRGRVLADACPEAPKVTLGERVARSGLRRTGQWLARQGEKGTRRSRLQLWRVR